MRALLVIVLMLSSACVTAESTRGEKLLAGLERRGFGGGLVVGGVSGLVAGGIQTALAVQYNSAIGAEARNQHASTQAAIIVPSVAASAVAITVGGWLYFTGRALVLEAIDGTPEEQAAAKAAASEARIKALRASPPASRSDLSEDWPKPAPVPEDAPGDSRVVEPGHDGESEPK